MCLIEAVLFGEDRIEDVTLHVILWDGRLIENPLMFHAATLPVADIRIVSLDKKDGLTIIGRHIKREASTVVGLHLNRSHILTIYQLSLKRYLLFQSAASLKQVIFVADATDIQRRSFLIDIRNTTGRRC